MGIRPQRRSAWSNVEEFIKKHIIWWFEKLIGRETLAPGSIDPSTVKRILVIRQHDQLGDFLLSVPALRAVRERFPDRFIAVLVRSYFAPVANLIPYIDDVIVFQEDASQWSFPLFINFWRKLRGHWDLTIVLNTVSHSLTSDLFVLLSGARYKLGFADKLFPGSQKNFFYNLRSPVHESDRHQSEKNLDIVRYIGCDTKDVNIVINILPAMLVKLREECKKFGISSTPVVGMHIGAGKPKNRWPVENFVTVAELLRRRHEVNIMLFWGPSDDEERLMCEFCRLLSFKPCNIGHPPLDDLAAYFRLCDVLVCNDTGVMHIAGGAGVPTLALFGPTNALEWKPLNESVQYIQSPTGRMEDIQAGIVEERIRGMMPAPMKGSKYAHENT